jgi:hypothetical protein
MQERMKDAAVLISSAMQAIQALTAVDRASGCCGTHCLACCRPDVSRWTV